MVDDLVFYKYVNFFFALVNDLLPSFSFVLVTLEKTLSL